MNTRRLFLWSFVLPLGLIGVLALWLWRGDSGRVPQMPPLKPRSAAAAKILASAKSQQGTVYNAEYAVISYPGGDVPRDKGACTDVIVRALRGAGLDLQRLIHQDMKRHFWVYPQKWGLPGPNTNIDHRRVPNQMRFLERHGVSLTCRVTPQTLWQWQPGDLVYWDTGRGRLHTGVVSDNRNARGEPYVIHNGWVCIEDDALTRWKIIGHYRYPKSK
jgi:uncharacterized protein YijF (DUF1287 family)